MRNCGEKCDNGHNGIDGPEMVPLPPGTFTMGSPADECGHLIGEGPQHPVTITQPFAASRFAVTVDRFAMFVAQSGHRPGEWCRQWDGKDWTDKAGSFRSPGFEQAGNHPVVCVSWSDAQAYAAWLSQMTGHSYRLLTEAEWEYAARAGTTAALAMQPQTPQCGCCAAAPGLTVRVACALPGVMEPSRTSAGAMSVSVWPGRYHRSDICSFVCFLEASPRPATRPASPCPCRPSHRIKTSPTVIPTKAIWSPWCPTAPPYYLTTHCCCGRSGPVHIGSGHPHVCTFAGCSRAQTQMGIRPKFVAEHRPCAPIQQECVGLIRHAASALLVTNCTVSISARGP